MFGHLRAADFVNLMERAELPAKHKAHIDACARCRGTWESLQSVHAEVTSMKTDIVEPDWVQFRSSVRDELLSRSIRRESAMRRWTGWAARPAVAWALSVFLAVGITTVTVLWKTEHPATPVITIESPVAAEPATETAIDAAPDRALFDDLVQLGDEQQEQLRQMLESAQKGPANRQ